MYQYLWNFDHQVRIQAAEVGGILCTKYFDELNLETENKNKMRRENIPNMTCKYAEYKRYCYFHSC